LDVRLENVKNKVRSRPEAAVAPQKIDHWDTVFQYQRDRWSRNFQVNQLERSEEYAYNSE
jgi:hypothetical protein